ncbi:MAG: ferritin-like domain-containing protein [Rhodospirillales bacterium]|nr:ferritin-like domain-containing protein [Rhodospirillales bacterium]
MTSLCEAACIVLNEPTPSEKVAKTRLYAQAWRQREITEVGSASPPDHPARPNKPELLAPREMPKRKTGSKAGKIALLHAIAHIELNAIDIAWDAVARFGPEMPKEFSDDWVMVADDEATHFQLLVDRLSSFDAAYGDHPAHNGLWDTATKTSDDVMRRMGLMPMLFEARGLDTTPASVERLTRQGDDETATIMARICEDEISHVAAGVKWFEHLAEQRGLEPIETFKTLVTQNTKTALKPPYNTEARDRAGMNRCYYEE